MHTVIGLTARHGFEWNDKPTRGLPFIAAAGSVDKALEALPTALKTYDRTGLIVDANGDPLARWLAVLGRTSPFFRELPKTPPAEGLVVEAGTKRFGVWLMPNNAAPGKLEDFLGDLVPAGDPTWTHALDATRAARKLGAPCAEKDEAKARIHTWLAWREKPGHPFGTALQAGTLASGAPHASSFVRWFERLFIAP